MRVFFYRTFAKEHSALQQTFVTYFTLLYETQHTCRPACQVPALTKCSNSQPTHIAYRSLYFPMLAELIKDTLCIKTFLLRVFKYNRLMF